MVVRFHAWVEDIRKYNRNDEIEYSFRGAVFFFVRLCKDKGKCRQVSRRSITKILLHKAHIFWGTQRWAIVFFLSLVNRIIWSIRPRPSWFFLLLVPCTYIFNNNSWAGCSLIFVQVFFVNSQALMKKNEEIKHRAVTVIHVISKLPSEHDHTLCTYLRISQPTAQATTKAKRRSNQKISQTTTLLNAYIPVKTYIIPQWNCTPPILNSISNAGAHFTERISLPFKQQPSSLHLIRSHFVRSMPFLLCTPRNDNNMPLPFQYNR